METILLLQFSKSFILGVWRNDPVPQDWVDAITLSLYEGKVSKSDCGDWRTINLLEAVHKIFSKVLTDWQSGSTFMSPQKATLIFEREGVVSRCKSCDSSFFSFLYSFFLCNLVHVVNKKALNRYPPTFGEVYWATIITVLGIDRSK